MRPRQADFPPPRAAEAAPPGPAAARLLLWQMLSPAFPTGGFAWSSGLETAMAAGLDAAGVEGWIADWLAFGGAWADAVLLSLALRPGADLAALDDLGRALALGAERLAETAGQGAAFAAAASVVSGRPVPHAVLPVAVGAACAPLALAPAEVIAAFLHAQAAALVHAAVRFLPMGGVAGQGALGRLHPLVLSLADRAATATEADLGTAAWGAEIAALAHETLPERTFRS